MKPRKNKRGYKWSAILHPDASLRACLAWLCNRELTTPAQSFDRLFPVRCVFVDPFKPGVPPRITCDLIDGAGLRLTLRPDAEPLPIVGPCRAIDPDEIAKVERLEPRGGSASVSPGDESARTLTDDEYRAACDLAETVLRRPDPSGQIMAERRLGALSLRLAGNPAPGLALAFTLPPAEARDLASVFVFRLVRA